jgi:hypothetical protein
MAVYGKIALQINAKIGGTLWFTQPPLGMPANSIVIGMDVFHAARNSSQSVLGLCATLDQQFTKYHN